MESLITAQNPVCNSMKQKSPKQKKSDTWPRQKKCVHCKLTHFYHSKTEYFEHLRKCNGNKMFPCSMCSFITQHKHHYLYHVSGHYNFKPFKCKSCSYEAINKAMLTSHEKSHTLLQQYPCCDCKFSSKFLNALKKHCITLNHQPGIALNASGQPDESILIDLHGSRRGKRRKPSESLNRKMHETSNRGLNETSFYPPNVQQNISVKGKTDGSLKCNYCNCIFGPGDSADYAKHIEEHVACESKRIEPGLNIYDSDSCPSSIDSSPSPIKIKKDIQETEEETLTTNASPLDLTKSKKSKIAIPVSNVEERRSVSPPKPALRRPPGFGNAMQMSDVLSKQHIQIISPIEPPLMKPMPPLQPIFQMDEQFEFYRHMRLQQYVKYLSTMQNLAHSCPICGTIFLEAAIYKSHMQYHSLTDPLQCNYCGKKNNDVVSFNDHTTKCPKVVNSN